MFRRFGTHSRGTMSIMMMAVMVVLALVIGGVIDFASLGNQKHNMQDVADGAAIAAAREMMVAKATDQRVQAVSDSYVAANYKGAGAKDTAAIVEKGRAVQVTLSASPKVSFPGPIGANAKRMTVSATAEIVGGGNVCMVGLSQSAPSTLNMEDNARLTADGCAIYSNSKSASSLSLHNMARVKANLICVAGGISGAESAASPKPTEDCPPLEDPLRDRPQPKVNLLQCDYLATVVITKVTLHPGVYCGGIIVGLGGVATLEPGLYTINNGVLKVTLGGTLKGEHVGFFMSGLASIMTLDYESHVDLTAPLTGDMAGLLFFQDRKTVLLSGYHNIRSKDARRLVGTMYFPNAKLMIEARNPVADKSEYTVIIAKEFELRDGPDLVLKTDYASSPIPLPDGVGNKAHSTVRLTK